MSGNTTVILTLIASVVLASCASIPLLTMWRLHSMTAADLANLDVNEIQAVVQIPRGFEPDISSFRLKLTLSKDHKMVLERIFTLRKLSEGRLVLPGVPLPNPDQNLFLIVLTPKFKQELEQLQLQLRNAKQSFDYYHFDIHFNLDSAPPKAVTLPLSVWIQLRKDQGFIEIVENAKLKIDRDKHAP